MLLATMSVAGLVSAKNGEEKKDSKNTDEKAPVAVAQCITVGMYVWCTKQTIEDTMCWGEGTTYPTYTAANTAQTHNSQLLTEYTCGEGTGSGW